MIRRVRGAMIEVEGVSKSFGQTKALAGVDMSVPAVATNLTWTLLWSTAILAVFIPWRSVATARFSTPRRRAWSHTRSSRSFPMTSSSRQGRSKRFADPASEGDAP